MNALDTLLAGLIDYAGLYPPAGLDMPTAVRNYLDYRNSEHASVLGRFIVDVSRLDLLRAAAGQSLGEMRLSVIVPPDADGTALLDAADRGFAIESIEVKMQDRSAMERISSALSKSAERYFEIPLVPDSCAALDAIAAVGARAKLRMGGITPDAFPATDAVVDTLQALAQRNIAFKATAGLHHPIRSRHRLTYAPDSISAVMHGFLNLFTAAAIVQSGGSAADARQALDEQSPSAFHISEDGFGWRDFAWSTEQIHSMRKRMFVSVGSCSFTEPIADLEAIGWL